MRIKKSLSAKQAAAIGLAVMSAVSAAPALADTVFFQQNANGQAYSYTFSNAPNPGSHTDAGNFPNNNNWSQVQVMTSDGFGDTYISQPSNWSTPTYPNSSTVAVELEANTVTLDVGVTVASLDTDGAFNILGGDGMEVAGSGITNFGTITVNSNQAIAGTYLTIDNGTLSGNGSVVLNGQTNLAQLNGIITQAAGHSILGQGEINAALTNSGTVNANVSGGTLSIFAASNTNSATFQATNGGTLAIQSASVAQGANGIITAATGSNVSLVDATIVGGKLSSSGTGLFLATGNDTFAGLTNNATVQLPGGQVISVTGNLVDNASITVNSDQAVAGTVISFDGGTLSGTGNITLNASSNLAQLNGSLTQAAGHTILGQGEISAVLTNSGTVNANIDGGTLYLLSSNTANSATFEATNGGILAIDGSAVTQTSGGQITASGAGNVLSFINSTVSGGTVSATGGAGMSFNNGALSGGTVTLGANGIMDILGGTNSIQGLTSGGKINIHAGSILNIVGNAVDNGTIFVNSDQNVAGTVIDFDGGTLSGTGALTLNNSSNLAQLNGSLTQAAGHTIQGQGEINAALTNSGTVNANVSGGTLSILAASNTNSATFQATNGGVLAIQNASVAQGANGVITAAAGSNVSLINATIVGGKLSSSGSGVIVATGTDGLNNLTNNATIQLPAGQGINVTGNLVDNASITVNSDQAVAGTPISFDGGVLSGSGVLTLNAPNNLADLNGSVTQSAGHTIQGQGDINAALTNNSTVNANVSGGTLYLLSTNTANSATFEATNGGILSIDNTTVTQGANGIITAASGSSVDLLLATIVGGKLNISGNGFYLATGTDVLNNLTNNAPIQLPGGNAISVTGNLVDNGSITVNSDQAVAGTVISFDGGILSGSGVLTLNAANNLADLNGTVTQSAGHTIQGQGDINAILTNSGTVSANVKGGTLYLLGGNTSNGGTFQAINGGTLSINSDLTDTGPVTVGVGSALVINGLLHLNGPGSLNAIGLTTINYGGATDPAGQIRSYLLTGYNSDKWTGPGINSSIAATNPGLLAVGYADGSTDTGTPATQNQILIKTTLAGDANLDGVVNFPDLLVVAQNFGKTGKDWAQGDFNYDGIVNFPDLLLIAQNFGKVLSANQLSELPQSFNAEWQLAETEIHASAVPEPASLAMLVLPFVVGLRRRRRAI